MAIRVAVPKEVVPGERRVALVPEIAARLAKAGFELCIERGAGAGAFHADARYTEAGAALADDAASLCAGADVVLKVQPPTADEIAAYRKDSIVIGFMQPHARPAAVAALRDKGVTSFAMELVPRISRAQSMDALSSQATVAGYKAVLLAADRSARFFPMLTTAAGTIRPARVLVIGAGVAGLQAIATARRLGAIVEAYDVRRAAREQVESLGAKFLQVEVDAEAAGGYARELTAEEKALEAEMLQRAVRDADAVITTAQIPGRAAPRLVSAAAVAEMKPGSVVIDLAAESGGNCELTQAGREIEHHGAIIYGPLNVPSMLPVHASEMYARNLYNFLSLLAAGGGAALAVDWEDEVIAASALTHAGVIRHAPTRAAIEGERP